MSHTERIAVKEALDKLSPVDRAWLDASLVEYREALAYLHDH